MIRKIAAAFAVIIVSFSLMTAGIVHGSQPYTVPVATAKKIAVGSDRYVCQYRYYPAFQYTNAAGARYLMSTGSWYCWSY